ncbi:MAG: D-cysteine desulfhydrase family protein [Gemmatimonadota bacterium]|nr:MAG: D-cysteine desulfhydrase family protein [Gemmatimonadota bacterium]
MHPAFIALDAIARTSLVHEPTPLIPAPRLAQSLDRGSTTILVKMDAETGFALGGNKVRKLEYELAPDRIAGVTCVITVGGLNSNHARVTAAAAARLGLSCILVLNGELPDEPTGNTVLHLMFGAELRMVATREQRDVTAIALAKDIETAGGKALFVPLGASTPIGTLGYVRAAREFVGQLDATPQAGRTWIFVSASSCGTFAGLALGFTLLGRDDFRLVGISPDVTEAEILGLTVELSAAAGEILGWRGELLPGLLSISDAYVGDGYALPSSGSREATARFGRTEGIVLDPVYTAKVAHGMIDWLGDEHISAHDRVVFWHTGGYPTVFG